MEKIINKICAQLPPGWTIELCMAYGEVQDGGGAWVNLVTPDGSFPSLPDPSSKTIEEQMNDALRIARSLGHEKI